MRYNKPNKLLYGVIMLAVIITALALLFVTQQPARGQGDGVLPWVVNTIPARGDELPIDQGVTFTFNVAMNQASVEASFDVSPDAPGTFRWRGDTEVTYTPIKPFDRETAYIFTIDSTARSSEGIGLRDTFSLKLHTTGYLTVTQFLPQDEFSVDLQPTITIVFNRPVVPLGTAEQMQNMPVPFKAYPEIVGKGEWLTTSIYSYKPSEKLQQGTTYIVSLKGLTDVSGSTLKEILAFKFSTQKIERPKPKSFSIHYLSPQEGTTGIFRSPRIRVGFDSPADVESAQQGFSLIGPDGKAIPGKFEWLEKKNELTFRPTELLDYSTHYTVKIDRTNIRSKDGLPLTTDATTTFTTLGLPEISSTSPNDGSLVDPSAIVSINFSNPMKLDDFTSRIEVSPRIPSVVLDADIGPDSNSARVQFSTLPSTVYTVTLNTKGMTDIWGTPLLTPEKLTVYSIDGEKIKFRFVTAALGPAVSLETEGQSMGLYNAYHQTRVFVTHRNIASVGMALHNVSLPLFLNAAQNTSRLPDEKEALVRRWVIPVYNPHNIMRYDLLSITNDGISIGQRGNVVCIEAAPSALAVGQKIRVVRKEVPADDNITPSVPASLNVRNEPGTQKTAIIGQAQYGTEFTVIDGPVCADRYVWWNVQSEDGSLEGWISEGDMKQPYVIPISGSAATATIAPTLTPSTTSATQRIVKKGELEPGIYRLEMGAPEITNNQHHITHVMLIATDNVTLKVARHEAFAWVTDLKSGQPAAGLSVQFYRLMQLPREQKVLPYGKPVLTDKDGIARLAVLEELAPANEVIYAAVSGGGHFGLAASSWTQGIDASDFQQPTMFHTQDLALYLYTDRRLYRPGDVVYFKGTIRQRNDAVYSLSDKKLIPVDITDPAGQLIYSKKLQVNDYGSFSDSFMLDSGGQLGEYRIVARPNKPEPKPTDTPTSTAHPVLITSIPNPVSGTRPRSTPMMSQPTPTHPPIPVQAVEAKMRPDDPQFVTQITVAHYTPPEFRVSVNPQVVHVAPGDTVNALVESSYYFGGPVSNATVQWQVRTDPYYFYYTGNGAYSFQDYNQDQIEQDYEDDQPRNTASGTGKTDDQGRYLIKFPAALGKSRRSIIYTVEAVVWDQSNQMVAERAQVVVDQGQFQVGVGVDNYVGTVNEKQNIRVISVNHDSSPLPNTYVNVKVVRRMWASVQTIEPGTGRTIWENEVVEKDITGGLVLTDSAGKANYSFVPQQGGAYKIYVTARDANDNQIKASIFSWIAGPGYVDWRVPNSNRIDLQADKTNYKVGDTATILIPTPFQGESTALITVERGGILRQEVLALHSNSTIYKLSITPDMAPDAFFSVTVIKGEDEHNFTAAFRTGLLQLNVDTDQLRLQVSVTADREKTSPREQVTYKIHVADYKGDPVQAEVGLALVDEAILSLMPDDLPSLMSYFYSRQGLGVRTANSLIFNIDQKTQEIINVQKGGGKGGNDYVGIFTVRQNFIPTPLWSPTVITDKKGDATVTVTLPDQLTTWVLDARVYTLPMGPTNTTLVGQTTQSLISTKPLLIRPEVPRFYVVGDTSVLSAIVNNNTGAAQEVAVSVEITGVAVSGDLTKYATIPANGRLKFDWPMRVLDTNTIDMTFKVISKDGRYLDAAKPITGQGDDLLLPVLRYETPDTVTTGGVIGNEGGIRTEGLLVPPYVTDANNASKNNALNIRIDRSLASSATAALKTLKIYDYYCIEQTVSRFLPDAVMFRAQQALGLYDQLLFDELSDTLETALQRLYNDQHVDGGWGWFINDRSDQLVSAYTVLGMAEARAAGWQLDDAVFVKAIEALRRSLKDVDDKTPSWDLNRQAFILYVLARASQRDVTGNANTQFYDVSRSVKLFDQRDRMNLDARAFLAMAFNVFEPTSGYHKVALLDSIKKAAKFSLTGRHWEESDNDYWNWTTNTRTTAIVLKALVEIEPASPLIPDTVRWLMTTRKFDSWETTQETAWSVMALTAFMLQTGDLTPDYNFEIAINDQAMTSGEKATVDNVRTAYDLRVSVANLLSDQVNKIKIQRTAGSGTLYYSAQLKTYLPVEQVKALSRGLIIERSYSLENDKDHKPITSAHVGDQIRVTLTIVVPETLNYVAIEDPIPAGTQSINTSLQTSQRLGKDDLLQYGWGYWVFTHTELRDDRTILYAPYLPKGTYQFIYQVRAGVPGTYHVLPANGHAFYMPEIFGRSAGQLFTLLPPRDETF